jgi:hypothetical protein
MTYFITTKRNGVEVEIRVPAHAVPAAQALSEMSLLRMDRLVPPWDMACLFPDRPHLHRPTSLADALIAAGCFEV